LGDNPPPSNKTLDEILFGMIDKLCGRFIGLTPFEVLNSPTKQVFDLWIDIIIHDNNNNKDKQNEQVEWVTSKNATWH
jgi:hypothetical protein